MAAGHLRMRSVPVSCLSRYRCEEAKWSTFVKIELNESFVHLRKRFAIEDYGGFKTRPANVYYYYVKTVKAEFRKTEKDPVKLIFETNIRNFSIRFQGPKFFYSLSPEIQNSESIRLFGKRLKKFLLS